MSCMNLCAVDHLLQHVFGDAHASACFSYSKLGSRVQLASACFRKKCRKRTSVKIS